jgi:hypothetical protein
MSIPPSLPGSTPPPLSPPEKTQHALKIKGVLAALITFLFFSILVIIFYLLVHNPANLANDQAQTKSNLTKQDRAYYNEISQAAVMPTLIIGIEENLSLQLLNQRSPKLLEHHELYSQLMEVSASKIANTPTNGIDSRLIETAAYYRNNRLECAKAWNKLKSPDMERAALGLSIGFFTDLVPDTNGNSKSVEEAFKRAMLQGLNQASSAIQEAKTASDLLQKSEADLSNQFTTLIQTLGPNDSLGIPSYQDAIILMNKRLEENTSKISPKITNNFLTECLTDKKSGKMDWTFLKGEIRDLKIVEKKIYGHCIIIKVEVKVIGAFSQNNKTDNFRMVFSALTDTDPELLFIE